MPVFVVALTFTSSTTTTASTAANAVRVVERLQPQRSPARHVVAHKADAMQGSGPALFPNGGPGMVEAEQIAIAFWGADPCNGTVSVSWGNLDPGLNAMSTWMNPTSAYGNPQANESCNVSFNVVQSWDWPMFCTIMVHEYGHLTGHQHVLDPANVMYASYVQPISQCNNAPDPTATAPPPAQPTQQPATQTAGSAKSAARRPVTKGHRSATKTKKPAHGAKKPVRSAKKTTHGAPKARHH